MKNLFKKIFTSIEKQGEDYSKDNELLANIAENDEEKSAIMQICDEIDETHIAYDEVSEAVNNGQSPEDWLEKGL